MQRPCKGHAKAIPPFLHAAKRDDWHHLVTNDEFQFFFNISPCRMWTLSRDDVVTKLRLDIQTKTFTFMFTIIWNPSGFYVVDRLLNHTKMNSAYFVTDMLIPLEQAIFPGGLEEGRRMKDDLSFISTIALFTQVGFQQIGLKNTVFSACHTHSIHLIWLLVTSTYFLQSRKNSNGFSWLTRTSLSSACKRFSGVLRGLHQKELNIVFQAWVG
jgi:hypothetical protein